MVNERENTDIEHELFPPISHCTPNFLSSWSYFIKKVEAARHEFPWLSPLSTLKCTNIFIFCFASEKDVSLFHPQTTTSPCDFVIFSYSFQLWPCLKFLKFLIFEQAWESPRNLVKTVITRPLTLRVSDFIRLGVKPDNLQF